MLILVHDQEVAQRPEETCLCKGLKLLNIQKKKHLAPKPQSHMAKSINLEPAQFG